MPSTAFPATVFRLMRLILRIVGILAVSVALWLYAQTVRLFTRRNSRRRYAWLCRGMRGCSRVVAGIIGMRIEVRGRPPSAPFVLVANHVSFTDILLLCATSPAWFVSKAGVARWPFFGPLVRSTTTLFIDRASRRDVQRVNAEISALVRDGAGVIFFPEGGTSDGREVQPFKPSLLQPAVELGLPVHYAVITYRTAPGLPPASELIPWYTGVHFGKNVMQLLSVPGFTAEVFFSPSTLQAGDRKELAIKAHAEIATLHRDRVQETAGR